VYTNEKTDAAAMSKGSA